MIVKNSTGFPVSCRTRCLVSGYEIVLISVQISIQCIPTRYIAHLELLVLQPTICFNCCCFFTNNNPEHWLVNCLWIILNCGAIMFHKNVKKKKRIPRQDAFSEMHSNPLLNYSITQLSI
jgi:hypothetical protein